MTDADRERARAAIKAASPEVYVDEFVIDGELPPLIETVAAALAEERAKARAPFLRLASEFGSWPAARILSPHDAGDRIRRAAKETE